MRKRHRKKKSFLSFLLTLLLICVASFTYVKNQSAPQNLPSPSPTSPTSYIILNDNIPSFSLDDLQPNSYIQLSPLDNLQRCQKAEAIVSIDTLATQDRESLGMIKPSGWHTVRYDDLISDKYLYNRCHLLAYSLTGLNRDERNLITGTRYLNVEGMLPFEMQILEYIKNTGNHVKYAVTPVFEGDNLLASGVEMEAYSIEDKGEGVCFHVYCENIQPGITIDYATGDSHRS